MTKLSVGEKVNQDVLETLGFKPMNDSGYAAWFDAVPEKQQQALIEAGWPAPSEDS